jgi:hypothetical protein
MIRSLVAKGASSFRAAAALKRTRHSVKERARKLGCPLLSIAEMTKSRTPGARWGHRALSREGEENER